MDNGVRYRESVRLGIRPNHSIVTENENVQIVRAYQSNRSLILSDGSANFRKIHVKLADNINVMNSIRPQVNYVLNCSIRVKNLFRITPHCNVYLNNSDFEGELDEIFMSV